MAQALTAPGDDPMIFKKFRQLCGRAGLLPASYIIPVPLIQTKHLVFSGAFSDVWEGIYQGNPVTVKGFHVYKNDDVRKARKVNFCVSFTALANDRRKVFCKGVAILKRLSHANIVPFLGISEAPAPLSMIYEWMPNGNVRDYVAKNPEISRLQLVR